MQKLYNGTIRANVNMVLGGKPVSFYLAYRNATEIDPGLGDVSEIALLVMGGVRDELAPHLSAELIFSNVTATSLHNVQDFQFTVDFPANTVGGAAGQSLPRNVAFVVQRSTGLTGRLGRGRVFLPGIPESQTSATSVLVPQLAQDFINALETIDQTIVTDVDYVPVTLSNKVSVQNQNNTQICETFLVEQWRVADLLLDTRRKRL